MKDKNTIYERYIRPIGIGFFLSAIGAIVIWYITDQNRNHDVDQRIFPTVSDLNETLKNNAAKPSETEVYIMHQEALDIKKEAIELKQEALNQGDSLLKTAEYFKRQTQRVDSFFILQSINKKRDSIIEKKKEESRAGRDKTNREILEILKAYKPKDTAN